MKRTTMSALLAAILVAGGVPAVAQAAATAARGLVSIRSVHGDGNFVSWRLLGSDAPDAAFDVYRDGVKVSRVTTATSYLDAGAPATASYSVRQVGGGV